MERINDSALYSNIRLRMAERGNRYTHDEDEETGFINELEAYKKNQKISYMRSILNPEAHIGKVPSRIPVESAVAPLKWNFTVTPNASGKFALIIDPFFQTGFLYQDSTVNGTGSGTVTNLTFAQDSTIIDQWRLVSSSLICKYYGNFNQLSGFFVGATTSNVNAATQTTYLTFNNVEDLSNRQVLKCIDGVKLVYSPMDEKATDFNSQTTYSGGTHPSRWQYLFVVVGDAFPNSACIRCDYFRNIEYTSTPAYKEYIPQNKEVPCDPQLPNIDSQVQAAPVDFRGGRITDKMSERNYGLLGTIGDKVADAMISGGKDLFGNYLKGYYNPLTMKGFK